MAARGEMIPCMRADEIVIDDAVVGWVEVRDDGVMVRECQRWEDGDQALLRLSPVADQALPLELVAESEPIRGDQEATGLRSFTSGRARDGAGGTPAVAELTEEEEEKKRKEKAMAAERVMQVTPT
ncbi:hypothetical protein SAY86_013837 [Trapa natans]|uniref:Uncharacterized protein n=1 Tax=Trapa natans TaxID=22666 RepID=A0AAN7KRP2_TRANT|nr:hypothetical protein SAY86_013837 [Trapa natans]